VKVARVKHLLNIYGIHTLLFQFIDLPMAWSVIEVVVCAELTHRMSSSLRIEE